MSATNALALAPCPPPLSEFDESGVCLAIAKHKVERSLISSAVNIMDDNIIVNEFMFCSRHGDEYCHRCGVDHRFANNYQIQHELGDILEEVDFFNLDVCTRCNAW